MTLKTRVFAWGTLVHNGHPAKWTQRTKKQSFCWQLVCFHSQLVQRPRRLFEAHSVRPFASSYQAMEDVNGQAEGQEHRCLALLRRHHTQRLGGNVILLTPLSWPL